MTYELTSEEKRRFKSVVDDLPDESKYVVLRNYSNLPSSVPGTDIDILVDSNELEAIESAFRNAGFGKYGTLYTRYRSFIKRVLFEPLKTASYAVSKPKNLAHLILKLNSKEYYWGKENFRMIKLQYGNLEVDLYNHLAYKSPTNQRFLNRTMIRVDPRVEQSMLENRMRYGDFYVPSPPDELVHMICRGVFDHDGDFRDYYKERCDYLYEEIKDRPDWQQDMEFLLEKIFYECSGIVSDMINSGEYDEIKSELVNSVKY